MCVNIIYWSLVLSLPHFTIRRKSSKSYNFSLLLQNNPLKYTTPGCNGVLYPNARAELCQWLGVTTTDSERKTEEICCIKVNALLFH